MTQEEYCKSHLPDKGKTVERLLRKATGSKGETTAHDSQLPNEAAFVRVFAILL